MKNTVSVQEQAPVICNVTFMSKNIEYFFGQKYICIHLNEKHSVCTRTGTCDL